MFEVINERLNGLLSQHFDPLALMAAAIEEEAGSAAGLDLRSFLAEKVKTERYDIYVTGHSKGAALSSTLALWLADTQGSDSVSEGDRWDVNRNATVHAYSFAGPTAGNGKFAAHSNRVIGDRCWRVVNKNDIVPCAWNELPRIPDLYGSSVVKRNFLRRLCDQVEPGVASLDYQQISSGDRVHEFAGPIVPEMPFLGQAIHQHLDAYFQETHLDLEMNLATFFTPVL